MPSVLIVGCGFVGVRVADLFSTAGWAVTGWTGTAESAARLGVRKPYPVAAHDITAVIEGFPLDVLVISVSSGGGDAERYRRVYWEGTRHLLAAFSPGRVVYTSSTSVYPQVDGGVVDENSPAQPGRETGKILRATEDLVLAHPGGMVARLAGIYGPGRSTLLRKFLAGEAVIEGDGGRWLNQIHRDDAAAAVYRLAQPDAPPGIYNVADDFPLTQLELYIRLAEHCGRALPPTGPIDPSRKRPWTSKRVSNLRLRAMGWRPAFPSFFDWAFVRDAATGEKPSATPI